MDIVGALFGGQPEHFGFTRESDRRIYATWWDLLAVSREAHTPAELRHAYCAREVAGVLISGVREDGSHCWFEHITGSRPCGRARVQGRDDILDALIKPVEGAFSLERRVVFVSWDGARAKRAAQAVGAVLAAQLPPDGEVIIARSVLPTANPLGQILDPDLLVADIHVVILTAESSRSLRMIWEIASSWRRSTPIIPLFAEPQAAFSPRLLGCGERLEVRQGVHDAVRDTLAAIGVKARRPTGLELTAVQDAAASPADGLTG